MVSPDNRAEGGADRQRQAVARLHITAITRITVITLITLITLITVITGV